MLPNDRAQPAAPDKPSWGARLRHTYRQFPLWVKVVIAIAAIPLAELILLAALVLGWRVAKSIQDTRMYGGRGSWEQPAAGHAGSAPPRPAGQPAGHPAPPTPGVRAQAAALPYAEHAARDHQGAPRPRPPI